MAPRITPLAATHPLCLKALSELPEDGEVFLVEADGEALGRFWSAGEVLVCRGRARAGDRLVLVPSGAGDVRLGERRGGRLVGDMGDVCSERRWHASGRIVAVLRPRQQVAVEYLKVALLESAPSGWSLVAGLIAAPYRALQWSEAAEMSAPAPQVTNRPAVSAAAPASTQLELFAA